MRKAYLTVVALILILAIPASAATTLSKYSLIVSGKKIALSADTGYIGKSGSYMTIPLKTVCDALSIEYSVTNGGKSMYMEGAKSTRVEVRSGYAFAKVDGKKKSLRAKVYLKSGQLMADLSVLKLLGADFMPATAAALASKG